MPMIETRSRRFQGARRYIHRVETLRNEFCSDISDEFLMVAIPGGDCRPRRGIVTTFVEKVGAGKNAAAGRCSRMGMFRLCQLPIACRRGKVLRLDVLYSVFRSSYTTSFTRLCSTSVVIRNPTSTTSSSSPQLDSQYPHCSCYLGHPRRFPTHSSYESKQWMR